MKMRLKDQSNHDKTDLEIGSRSVEKVIREHGSLKGVNFYSELN